MFALSVVNAYYLLTDDTELELMCTLLEALFALTLTVCLFVLGIG